MEITVWSNAPASVNKCGATAASSNRTHDYLSYSMVGNFLGLNFSEFRG